MSPLPVELELESAVVASAETVPVRFKLGEIGAVSPPIYVCVSSPEGVVRSKQMVEEGGTQILLETSDMPLGDYEVRLVSDDFVLDTAVLSIVDEASARRAKSLQAALEDERLSTELAMADSTRADNIIVAFAKLELACDAYRQAGDSSSAVEAVENFAQILYFKDWPYEIRSWMRPLAHAMSKAVAEPACNFYISAHSGIASKGDGSKGDVHRTLSLSFYEFSDDVLKNLREAEQAFSEVGRTLAFTLEIQAYRDSQRIRLHPIEAPASTTV